ncbi:uncharacterized protein [Anabrus simplex]|uniref:uncharacterized protein isoform X2 n=1 Tax=Anabrus simplex TaxID=316456 RepID=UPI0035A39AA1
MPLSRLAKLLLLSEVNPALILFAVRESREVNLRREERGTMDDIPAIKCEPEDQMENGEVGGPSIMSTVEEVDIKTEMNEDMLLADVKPEIPVADIEIKDEVLEPSEWCEQSVSNFPPRSVQHVSVPMASDEEEFDVENGSKKHLDRALLVRLVSKHTVVLEKSQTASVVSSKRRAWTMLTEEFSNAVGKKVSVGDLKKLLNNMKSCLKKKTDLKAIGNTVIKLMDWEKDLLGILDKAANPVFKKIPGSLSAGIKRGEDSSPELETKSVHRTSSQNKDRVEKNGTGIPPKKVRKCTDIVGLNETEETEHLSLLELQRLVLLQQSKVYEMKIRRRENELNKIKQSQNERDHRDKWTETN